MNAHEKSTFCGVFKTAKLLDGSASNISKCVHVNNRKISGYKSHDAHFMLHYLLPVATKSTMSNIVAEPLIRFGSFFRYIVARYGLLGSRSITNTLLVRDDFST